MGIRDDLPGVGELTWRPDISAPRSVVSSYRMIAA